MIGQGRWDKTFCYFENTYRHMGMMSMWDKIKEHMENTLGTPLGTLYGSTWEPLPLQKRNRIGNPLAIHAKHMV